MMMKVMSRMITIMFLSLEKSELEQAFNLQVDTSCHTSVVAGVSHHTQVKITTSSYSHVH
jgi:hypothetical protein